MIAAVEGGVWDVIVIGGGATGLGIAVDAQTRGYRTLLLEQYDFAKGTSSRATKLVHGGVRYLAQGNVGLVYEALHERTHLLEHQGGGRPVSYLVGQQQALTIAAAGVREIAPALCDLSPQVQHLGARP